MNCICCLSAGNIQGSIRFSGRILSLPMISLFRTAGGPGIYLRAFEKHTIFWHDVKISPRACRLKFKFLILTHRGLHCWVPALFWLHNTAPASSFSPKHLCLLAVSEHTDFIVAFARFLPCGVFLTALCHPCFPSGWIFNGHYP